MMSKFRDDYANLSAEQRREIRRQIDEAEAQLGGAPSDFERCTSVHGMSNTEFESWKAQACAHGDAQRLRDIAAKTAADAAKHAARRAGLPENPVRVDDADSA